MGLFSASVELLGLARPQRLSHRSEVAGRVCEQLIGSSHFSDSSGLKHKDTIRFYDSIQAMSHGEH